MSASPAPLRVHTLIDSLNWGGAESLLADLAMSAPECGIELSVGYLQERNGSPSAARLRAAGVEPQLVGVRRLLDLESLRRVRENVARARPDVVHAHLGAADFFGALATRRLGLPMVSTIHLMGGVNPGTQFRDRVKERLMARARRHGSARVIAVSDASRAAYIARGWDRPDHVVTVHNGIVPPQPRTSGADVRAQLGLAPDALVVTMVTVLRPGKGHEAVADAVARLLPRFPQLRLLVAGSGPSEAHVRELMAPLGDHALLLGHRSDVVELLGATDVLLHPTYMDAFPTALLEAGAMRLPVVATAVGGIPEIVVDGETGVLLPAPPQGAAVAEALGPLLADAGLRERLGAAARARFERQFTSTRWAQRLRELYDLVIAEHPRASRR